MSFVVKLRGLIVWSTSLASVLASDDGSATTSECSSVGDVGNQTLDEELQRVKTQQNEGIAKNEMLLAEFQQANKLVDLLFHEVSVASQKLQEFEKNEELQPKIVQLENDLRQQNEMMRADQLRQDLRDQPSLLESAMQKIPLKLRAFEQERIELSRNEPESSPLKIFHTYILAQKPDTEFGTNNNHLRTSRLELVNVKRSESNKNIFSCVFTISKGDLMYDQHGETFGVRYEDDFTFSLPFAYETPGQAPDKYSLHKNKSGHLPLVQVSKSLHRLYPVVGKITKVNKKKLYDPSITVQDVLKQVRAFIKSIHCQLKCWRIPKFDEIRDLYKAPKEDHLRPGLIAEVLGDTRAYKMADFGYAADVEYKNDGELDSEEDWKQVDDKQFKMLKDKQRKWTVEHDEVDEDGNKYAVLAMAKSASEYKYLRVKKDRVETRVQDYKFIAWPYDPEKEQFWGHFNTKGLSYQDLRIAIKVMTGMELGRELSDPRRKTPDMNSEDVKAWIEGDLNKRLEKIYIVKYNQQLLEMREAQAQTKEDKLKAKQKADKKAKKAQTFFGIGMCFGQKEQMSVDQPRNHTPSIDYRLPGLMSNEERTKALQSQTSVGATSTFGGSTSKSKPKQKGRLIAGSSSDFNQDVPSFVHEYQKNKKKK